MTDENTTGAEPAAETASIEPAAETTATPETGVEKIGAETEETTEQAETTEEPSEDAADPEKPRRLNRSQRLQRTNARLANENAELASRLAELERKAQAEPKGEAEPKEEDFNGDYFKYVAAKAAHDSRQAVRAEFQAQKADELQQRVRQNNAEAVERMQEKADELSETIPDLQETLDKYHSAGGKFAPHVQRAIHSLEAVEEGLGVRAAYYLAKNPGLASDLNSADPIQAAVEIADLRSELALPKPKKQTQAPPPVKPGKGGATPPRDLSQLADSDMDAFVKLRNKQDAERGKRR
jgi:hypothetical protein